MRHRSILVSGTAGAAALALASPAAAHGLSGRADLPVPAWLFSWAVAIVLVVSFLGLAVLWPSPKLEREHWRPLPWGLGRALGGRTAEIVAGTVGVGLLALVIWSGLAGTQDNPGSNFASVFVFVVFWVGLVPVSVLLGDVYGAFNPWRALGRAGAWAGRRLFGDRLPEALPYPEGLGRWPAVAGLLAFAWLELVAADGASPRNVAIATLAYTVATLGGMALFGVEAWTGRGEAFAFYFNLFSRIAAFGRQGREIGLRRPLAALSSVQPLPGTAFFIAAMIGIVTFDGFQENPLWQDLRPSLEDAFSSLGLGAARAGELAAGIGLAGAIALVFGLFCLGIAGVKHVAGGDSTDLARAFAPSLVPIALAYVGAHYLTLLLFQGQAIVPLASDPLGHGWDLFGTASYTIDYTLIGATTSWYAQVALVVAGHVAALCVAHDRALVLFDDTRAAVRSQYWMLAVMVAYTSLALWLLSQANA